MQANPVNEKAFFLFFAPAAAKQQFAGENEENPLTQYTDLWYNSKKLFG